MVDLVDLVLCAKSRIGNWESAHKEGLARLGLHTVRAAEQHMCIF